MQGMLRKFGASVVVLGAFAVVADALGAAATGRAAYNVTQMNRTGTMQAMSSQRMPTMPTLPGNSVGNLSPDLPTNNSGNGNNPDNPDEPDEPDVPETECPDGGVKDSDYTIEDCMRDVLFCVNTGALPGGINDMFDENVRNSIVNGMGLCRVQVERCITQVRKNCENIYRTSADVWIDFNARQVQPAYYNFVLGKTGLTPNQAENTCLLLDRNTYGASFNAVSNSGGVTAEYNQAVGAYNNQNGNVLVKTHPMGVQVNNNGLTDAQRGHYARWNPTTAECLVRVAAYNKDTHIKNSWLFGAAGDDEPAEVWRSTGDTFTCNRDLFGFSLMNKTSTAAVVGIGGGAVVGAGVGAIAGHGARAFDCSREKHREMLTEELRTYSNFGTISEYMETKILPNVDIISPRQCEEVVELYDRYTAVKSALKNCNTVSVREEEITQYTRKDIVCAEITETSGTPETYETSEIVDPEELNKCFAAIPYAQVCVGRGFTTVDQCLDLLNSQATASNDSAGDDGLCSFEPLNLDRARGTGIYCSASGDARCKNSVQIGDDIDRLHDVFNAEMEDLLQNGEKSNMGKSIGIGLGVGVGAGSLATAITAMVEHSNINCRVGDNLAQVGYGKSYSIGSLRDFYVKWGLRLPDVVAPTATAVDCASWRRACGTLTDFTQCKNAQLNYRPDGAATTTLVSSACAISGSECIENYPVARSYGACE